MQAILKRCLFTAPLWILMTAAQAHLTPGDTPPDFLGNTRAEDAVHLSGLHGKVVVVTFWASWCHYCQEELPSLAGIQKLVSPEQLQVVAVNRDDRDTFLKLNRYLAKKTPNLILTFDPGPVGKAYQINGIPNTFLIDRDGKVANVYVGYDDDMLDSIASDINSLLAKPAKTVASPPS
jgi:thiol-disulfide isomerase/thioredoxin